MTRRILVLHHIEPTWESGIRAKGVYPDEYLDRVIRFVRLNRRRYERIILTTLEGDDGYPELRTLVDEVQDWSYAWEDTPEASAEYTGLKLEDFIEVDTPHRVAYIYPYIKDWKDAGYTVTLAGAFEGECLTDMELTLRHLQIPVSRAESLIV